MKPPRPLLLVLLLLGAAFALAAQLHPRAETWSTRNQNASFLQVLLGDGRRLFASHFFEQADVSFHGGYYPSIFDRREPLKDTRHLTGADDPDHDHSTCGHDHSPKPAATNHVHSADGSSHEPAADKDHDDAHDGEPDHAEDEHMKSMALGAPRDWIERFGRNFMVTDHLHMESGQEREILPWLKISAELDPQRVDTYTVAAYWLRTLAKTNEAQQFLREGLRNNPDSYQIMFELGRLYQQANETDRARNLWELALHKWDQVEANQKEPDLLGLSQIALYLGRLEESATNYPRAIQMLDLARRSSPAHSEVLAKDIETLKQKLPRE